MSRRLALLFLAAALTATPAFSQHEHMPSGGATGGPDRRAHTQIEEQGQRAGEEVLHARAEQDGNDE